ncbi:MAG: Fe-S protein assembly co-chaperone HscB [Gammaproteobacteria bacterium]|nr:Fe-S protein assembly co-chaperone HscB [Gammaproteobacteria bacterium]
MQTLNLKQNYFELFGLEVTFQLDKQVIQDKLKQLLAELHPDRFVNASEQQKRLSMQQSCWLNEASQTLRNPVTRARYMLELNGVELNDEAETTSDTMFLMEQIELREQLAGCRKADDPVACCESISVRLETRARQLGDEFMHNFNCSKLEAARLISRKMQFIHRIQEQVMELQFELEDEFG